MIDYKQVRVPTMLKMGKRGKDLDKIKNWKAFPLVSLIWVDKGQCLSTNVNIPFYYANLSIYTEIHR